MSSHGTIAINADQINSKRTTKKSELQPWGLFMKPGHRQKTRYLEISEVPKKSTSPRFPEVRPVEHSRIKVSGRFRKIRTEVTPILVYANGDALRAPARILLRANEMRSWQQILNVITDKVELRTGATRWIYSMDGQVVTRPSDLEKEGKYVAVGSEKNFKELPYTEDKVPYMSGAASPRQQQKYSPGKLPPIKRVRKSDGGTNSTRNSTGSSEISDKSKAKSKRVSPKKEDDQVFHAKPVKHKRTTRQVDLDKDEGGVFKARHVRDRDAREIEESKDTRVDLPIDQVEAEEIKDEEIEDTSKSISSDKELKKNPSDEKDKDLAAIKIQSGYRGHKARKQYKARKAEKHVKKERDTPPVRSSNPVPPVKPSAKQHDQPKLGQKKYAVLPPIGSTGSPDSADISPNNTPDINNSDDAPDNAQDNIPDDSQLKREQDAAATTIQASYRGSVARKKYQRDKKEKKAQENDNDKVEDDDNANNSNNLQPEEVIDLNATYSKSSPTFQNEELGNSENVEEGNDSQDLDNIDKESDKDTVLVEGLPDTLVDGNETNVPTPPQSKPTTPQLRAASRRTTTPNSKSQALNSKPQTPNSKPQTPNSKPQTPNAKHQTPNSKPQTPNSKPQTPKAKPQTPNSKPPSRGSQTKPATPNQTIQSKPTTPNTERSKPSTPQVAGSPKPPTPTQSKPNSPAKDSKPGTPHPNKGENTSLTTSKNDVPNEPEAKKEEVSENDTINDNKDLVDDKDTGTQDKENTSPNESQSEQN